MEVVSADEPAMTDRTSSVDHGQVDSLTHANLCDSHRHSRGIVSIAETAVSAPGTAGQIVSADEPAVTVPGHELDNYMD